jgi:RNA polymerase sigma factor (sigma-70 family)
MQHADQKYINALLDNDTVLLEELYQKYFGKIKSMVVQNNGTASDAADIFQEALLYIYHKAKLKNFILTCPLDAFLYLVCKNKWVNELNKRKFGRVTIKDLDGYNNIKIEEDSFQLAEECKLQQIRKDLFTEKLEELGETCKQLLRLSWSGRSMQEVADILKVTYGYARKKKSECMFKLVGLVKQSKKFKDLKR